MGRRNGLLRGLIVDANTKKQLMDALKTINVKELYASEDENKRKWFRFGAYDALRMACEVILAWPEIKVGNDNNTKG